MSDRLEPWYQAVARAVQALKNCKERDNTIWLDRWDANIKAFVDMLPSGSGVDSGPNIDLDRSNGERLIFTFAFHHMHESGMYDGWTEHELWVTPSLQFGFSLRITGRDRNGIKEYLHDVFHHAIGAMVDPHPIKQWENAA